MLYSYTKFQRHRPIASKEEDCFKVLPYMDMAAILVMWPGSFVNISFPHPKEAPCEINPVISEVKMFEECERQWTTDDGGLPIL